MLSDFIKSENIVVNLESSDKDELFAELLEALIRLDPKINREEAMKALVCREEKMNTCVMPGVGVPHANCESVEGNVAVLGISKAGIDYGISAYDGKEATVHAVIMILFGQGNAERHLHVLADCAAVLQNPRFMESVVKCQSSQEVFNLIKDIESAF